MKTTEAVMCVACRYHHLKLERVVISDESSGTKRKCCPKCGCGGFINVEVKP